MAGIDGTSGSRMCSAGVSMLEDRILEVQIEALARIQAARALEELETARVDVLGRKGSLAQFSKEFGKLSPDERAAAGKALNAAKEAIESALEAKKAAFSDEALQQRLASEWLDLTL